MKLVSIAFLFIVTFITSTIHSQVFVCDPISITDGNDEFGKKKPKIGINGAGELVIFWVRTGANEAFFINKKTNSGFTTPILIPLNGINPDIWTNMGPDMAVFENHIYIVFEKYGEAIYMVHSNDGGVNWDIPIAAYTPPEGRKATIPNIAVNNEGQPYISYVNTNNSEADAYYGLVKSVDFGNSFSSESIVNNLTDGNEVCECCNGDMVIDENGTIYIAFRNNNDNIRDNWIAVSNNNGVTFDTLYDMDQTDWQIFACPTSGPSLLVQENRVISTFFSAASDWDNGIYFSSLDLETEQISDTYNIPQITDVQGLQNRPKLAGKGDTLAVVFENNYGGPNISISISVSGPDGLSIESIPLTEAQGSQKSPHMVFHNGSFHVVYEDGDSDTVLYQELSFDEIVEVENTEINKESIRISPNPVSNILYVQRETNEKALLQIINMNKQIVFEEYIQGESSSIDIHELKIGDYLILINYNNSSIPLKFIKN